nr:PREDICTED: uncharacterized protein LOC109040214 isoform X1 [Bemisia tabaci]
MVCSSQLLMTAVRMLLLSLSVAARSSVPITQLSFQKGDVIVHGGQYFYHILKRVNLPPFHSFLALSDHELFSTTLVREAVDGKKRWRSRMLLVDSRHLSSREKDILVKKLKPKKKHKTIGDVGVALAWRLIKSNLKLYFHATRCNTNHYVDYVTYGTTFGRWWKPLYMPTHPKCPLHLVVTGTSNVSNRSGPGYITALKTKKGEIPLP